MGGSNHELSKEFLHWFHPHELFHGGCPAWFFKTPFPEDFNSPVGDCLEYKQGLANLSVTNLKLTGVICGQEGGLEGAGKKSAVCG